MARLYPMRRSGHVRPGDWLEHSYALPPQLIVEIWARPMVGASGQSDDENVEALATKATP
jgi:hypothetical protein